MTCSGCGVELDQTQEQVNSLGSQVLDPSLHGAANTFEVVSEQQHKKLDLISGRVVEYDALDYVETHTHAVIPPEYRNAPTAEPRLVGQHQCVFADVRDDNIFAPQLGKCSTPTEHQGPVARLEVDLRYGSFIL